MKGPKRTSEGRSFAEERASLARITAAPLTWAAHFVLSYAAAAVWCAGKGAGPGAAVAQMLPLRIGLGAATLVALGVIAWLGWRSWRQWDLLDDYDYEHETGVGEDRHEFLGHAAFLLSVVSFVGVAFTALPLIFVATCR